MQTRGQYLVGLDFNPSGNQLVTDLKTSAAGFIDLVDAIPKIDTTVPDPAIDAANSEIARLKAIAVTNAEQAAMWAVKAATKKPRA